MQDYRLYAMNLLSCAENKFGLFAVQYCDITSDTMPKTNQTISRLAYDRHYEISLRNKQLNIT